MKIPRVDRCTTCHVAADRKGFEDPKIRDGLPDAPAHPPHGRQRVACTRPTSFGCTPCHGGRDRATSFWSAGHSPETEAQKARVDEEVRLGVRPVQREPGPPAQVRGGRLLPLPREGGRSSPRRPTLDAGMRVVEIARLLGLPPDRRPREAGPAEGRALAREGRREGPAGVDDALGDEPGVLPGEHEDADLLLPGELRRRVRPASADAGAEGDERARAGSRTTRWSTRSWRTSTTSRSRPTCPPVAGQGDAARGAKLLADRGCYGCHLADPKAQRDLTGTYRQFGPNLAGVGSKASRDWIYHWILNPKEWNPDTKMPNLRLTEAEALDIAEYLSTLKAPAGLRRRSRCRRPTRRSSTRSPCTSRCRRRRSSTRRPSSRRWTSTRKRGLRRART